MIKIASNSATYHRMRDNMDVNAGRIADGERERRTKSGREIFDLVLRVASGEQHVQRATGPQRIRAVAHRPGNVDRIESYEKAIFIVDHSGHLCRGLLSGQSEGQDQGGAKPDGPAKASALDKTTLENYIRHLQAWDHSISIEDRRPQARADGRILSRSTSTPSRTKRRRIWSYYVSKDGAHHPPGHHYETAENPFKPDLDKLKNITAALRLTTGLTGAPVVIVEFSDFECPFCRDEAKTLRANLLHEYPKEVHLYHLDMPLEAVHPWARAAANVGHCVYKQNPAPSGITTTGSTITSPTSRRRI